MKYQVLILFVALATLTAHAGDENKPALPNCGAAGPKGFAALGKLAQAQAALANHTAEQTANAWAVSLVTDITSGKFATLQEFADHLDGSMPKAGASENVFLEKATGEIKKQGALTRKYMDALQGIQQEMGLLNANPETKAGKLAKILPSWLGGNKLARMSADKTQNGTQAVDTIRQNVHTWIGTIDENIKLIDQQVTIWKDEAHRLEQEILSWQKFTGDLTAQLADMPAGQIKSMAEMMLTRGLDLQVNAQDRLLNVEKAISDMQLVRGNQGLSKRVLTGPVLTNIDGIERDAALAAANAPAAEVERIALGLRQKREKLARDLADDIQRTSASLIALSSQPAISHKVQTAVEAIAAKTREAQAQYILGRRQQLEEQTKALGAKIAAAKLEIAGRQAADNVTDALGMGAAPRALPPAPESNKPE